jgi:hypothetical protein
MSAAVDTRAARTVHLMVADKFIAPFVDFVLRHFDANEHRFCLLGAPRSDFGLRADQPLDWIAHEHDEPRLLQALFAAERIVIHGLWSERVLRLLYALPSLARKSHWVIWGGDLYDAQWQARTPGHEQNEALRRAVITQLGGAVGLPGDMDVAHERYGFRGERLVCFTYPSNLASSAPLAPREPGPLRILVGNSATESNCHLEVFARLTRHWQPGMEVHCPLAYGDPAYRDLVIANGRGQFGDDFHAITTLMPLADYNAFLGRIDAAVLHHNRQQGLGNAVTLLSLGKKVYARPEQSHSRQLASLGVRLFALAEFNAEPLDEATRAHNAALLREHHSEARLVQGLAALFAPRSPA